MFLLDVVCHGHCELCGLENSSVDESGNIVVNGIKGESRIEALGDQ